MFFVSDVPNNGQNVLDIMVTKPNRERQKLMREQNILKQVCALCRASWLPMGSWLCRACGSPVGLVALQWGLWLSCGSSERAQASF